MHYILVWAAICKVVMLTIFTLAGIDKDFMLFMSFWLLFATVFMFFIFTLAAIRNDFHALHPRLGCHL